MLTVGEHSAGIYLAHAPLLSRDDAVVVDFAMAQKMLAVLPLYLSARRYELSDSTIRTLSYNLRLVAMQVGNPPMSQLSREHVEAWLASVKLSPATLRTRLSQVRGLCAWGVEHGYLAVDPTIGVRGPRQPRRLPRGLRMNDARKLVAAAPDARSRLVLLLMLQEGLRRREVAGLSLGDVDTSERTMLVVGKGSHERLLPISDETWRAMVAYLSEVRVTAGPLIRSLKDGHKAVQPATIGRLVSDTMMAAGIKQRPYDGRSGHSCRHTAASHALLHGAHLRDVQMMLGHRHLSSVETYLPLVVKDLREAMGGRRYMTPPTPPADL